MTDLRTAAQQALTILEAWKHKGMWGDWDGVTDALKAALVEDAMQKFTDVNQEIEAALAEPVQEPVAWLFTNLQSGDYDFCYQEDEHDHDREMWHKQPLYTAPPQRKPLTETSAERTLKRLGYTDCGGEFWKPPLGAPAEPVQEPVAWMIYTEGGTSAYVTDNPNDLVGAYRALALYTAPPQRKPLMEEEILSVLRLAPPEPSLWPHLKDEAVVGDVQKAVLAIARAIERAHGIV